MMLLFLTFRIKSKKSTSNCFLPISHFWLVRDPNPLPKVRRGPCLPKSWPVQCCCDVKAVLYSRYIETNTIYWTLGQQWFQDNIWFHTRSCPWPPTPPCPPSSGRKCWPPVRGEPSWGTSASRRKEVPGEAESWTPLYIYIRKHLKGIDCLERIVWGLLNSPQGEGILLRLLLQLLLLLLIHLLHRSLVNKAGDHSLHTRGWLSMIRIALWRKVSLTSAESSCSPISKFQKHFVK